MKFNILLIFKICLIATTTVLAQSKYMYRGFMLDTARQFFPKPSIFKIIDYMDEANLNVLHLHFTDDESFSVEWDYDNNKLTKSASLNGQYYTKDDIREIITYARQYNIVVVPEFDFPAHVGAWSKAYPELMLPGVTDEFDVSNPMVFELMDKLFEEFFPLFSDAPFIHMGHDEIANTQDESVKSLNFAYKQAIKYQRKPIIWNDLITDKNIRQPKCLPYVIQVWTNQEALDTILELGYPNIVSIADYFYIGNDVSSPKHFVFPDDPNIIGFEVVYFSSITDDPNDVEWVRDFIMETKDF